jgi:hypothetical protein
VAVVILLGICSLSLNRSGQAADQRWAGLFLGLTQAVLLMLPPLMKAWVLEFNVGRCYGTTLAILGASKRVFAIITMIAISWLGHAFGFATPAAENALFYGLAMILTSISLVILLFHRRLPG